MQCKASTKPSKAAIIDQNSLDHSRSQQEQPTKELAKPAKAMKQDADNKENPKTPTSEENRIPAPRSPPPAPRKKRRVAMQCVRKLDFCEPRTTIPSKQAVQEFFTSSFDQINARKAFKRSASLAFDRLTSNPVSIPTQII